MTTHRLTPVATPMALFLVHLGLDEVGNPASAPTPELGPTSTTNLARPGQSRRDFVG